MSVRRAVELACRNVSFRRRLPKNYGNRPIYVTPDAALRWLGPSNLAFEKQLLDLADTVSPGEVVWDIGANVGAFAFPAAHRSRTLVVAVEADAFLVKLLRRSFAANPDLNLKIIPCAASDELGRAEFAIAGRGRCASGLAHSLVSRMHGQTRETVMVATVTLDSLLERFHAPNLVKIDVEGAELLVLKGSSNLLRTVRPRLYIEVAGATRKGVEAILAEAGYDSFAQDQHNLLAIPQKIAHPLAA